MSLVVHIANVSTRVNAAGRCRRPGCSHTRGARQRNKRALLWPPVPGRGVQNLCWACIPRASSQGSLSRTGCRCGKCLRHRLSLPSTLWLGQYRWLTAASRRPERPPNRTTFASSRRREPTGISLSDPLPAPSRWLSERPRWRVGKFFSAFSISGDSCRYSGERRQADYCSCQRGVVTGGQCSRQGSICTAVSSAEAG